MNQSVTAPTSAGIRRAWPLLSLLLAASTLEVAQSTAPPALGKETGEPLPYLRFVGTLPLRFQEALPPPDLGGRPPAGAPPRIGGKTNAGTNQTLASDVPATASTAVSASAEKQDVKIPGNPSAKTVTSSSSPSVLPDDADPKVRPEDFLPFFQFPGAGTHGGESVAAPAAPAKLPPSTATYHQ